MSTPWPSGSEALAEASWMRRWWREHRSIYLACAAMGLALLGGLLLRIDAYNDDLIRQADGSYSWGPAGRPIADWLYSLINSGGPTTALSPLGGLLSVAILALAATLLAGIFLSRSPFWAAVASAGLFAQPYGLANLSFQFDAPLMTSAMLLAMAAGWVAFRPALQATPGRRVLLQGGLLSLSLGLYQAAFGIFWVVALAGSALRVWLRDPTFRLRSQLVCLLAASALGALLYRLLWLPQRRLSAYAREHASLPPLQDLPATIHANWSHHLSMACSDWCGTAPGFWTAALLLITLLLALAPLLRPSRRFSALLATALLLLSWVVAYGPQLLLARPVMDARTFLPFGAIVGSCVLFVVRTARQMADTGGLPVITPRVVTVPLLALVWSYAVSAYSYANAYGQQRRLEVVLMSQLSAHLDMLPPHRLQGLKQIDFIGRLPRSPATANAIRRFPAFAGMVSPLVGNGSFGRLQLRDVGGLDLAYAPPSEERTRNALAGKLPMLLQTRRFQVMEDGPVLVVVSRQDL